MPDLPNSPRVALGSRISALVDITPTQPGLWALDDGPADRSPRPLGDMLMLPRFLCARLLPSGNWGVTLGHPTFTTCRVVSGGTS